MVALYDYVVPKPKSECNKVEQLEVSFAAGYIAGAFQEQDALSWAQEARNFGCQGLKRGLSLCMLVWGTATALASACGSRPAVPSAMRPAR